MTRIAQILYCQSYFIFFYELSYAFDIAAPQWEPIYFLLKKMWNQLNTIAIPEYALRVDDFSASEIGAKQRRMKQLGKGVFYILIFTFWIPF